MRREWTLCVITVATERKNVKKHHLKSLNRDFVSRSYLSHEKGERRLQQSPCKSNEGESCVCNQPRPSHSPHSHGSVFLLIVCDPVWNWMIICQNKSVELSCSARPYLSCWREKEKEKEKNTKQNKHHPRCCHLWNMKSWAVNAF